jgi:outer membrane protein assembly factor BamB
MMLSDVFGAGVRRLAFSLIRVFGTVGILVSYFVGSFAIAQEPQGDVPTWQANQGVSPLEIWRTRIGRDAGSPVIYRDLVLVTSDNSAERDPGQRGDRGTLMCFSRAKGEFIWQMSHSRLPHRANDIPGLGLMERPCIDGTRCYYQSNRGELICLNLERTGGKGPDVHWELDLVNKCGVFKRDACDIGNPHPSPLVVDDLVYCITGNGSKFGYPRAFADLPFVPKPDAPSFLAADKKTGQIVWSSNAPGKKIMYGQWASPGTATVGGKSVILFPGGDGVLYAIAHDNGKLLGKVDCNRPTSSEWAVNHRGQRAFFLSCPTIVGDTAYIGLNQDLEKTEGVVCPILALDLMKLSSGDPDCIRWRFADKHFDGTTGPVATSGSTVFAISASGQLVALDRFTGRVLWRVKLDGASRFGGPVVHDGKVFVGSLEYLWIFDAGPNYRCRGRVQFDELLMSSPVFDRENVLLSTSNYLWCLRLH